MKIFLAPSWMMFGAQHPMFFAAYPRSTQIERPISRGSVAADVPAEQQTPDWRVIGRAGVLSAAKDMYQQEELWVR
jgi:hypothetical protein